MYGPWLLTLSPRINSGSLVVQHRTILPNKRPSRCKARPSAQRCPDRTCILNASTGGGGGGDCQQVPAAAAGAQAAARAGDEPPRSRLLRCEADDLLLCRAHVRLVRETAEAAECVAQHAAGMTAGQTRVLASLRSACFAANSAKDGPAETIMFSSCVSGSILRVSQRGPPADEQIPALGPLRAVWPGACLQICPRLLSQWICGLLELTGRLMRCRWGHVISLRGPTLNRRRSPSLIRGHSKPELLARSLRRGLSASPAARTASPQRQYLQVGFSAALSSYSRHCCCAARQHGGTGLSTQTLNPILEDMEGA